MKSEDFKKLKNVKLSELEKRELFERIRARSGQYELDYPIKSPFFSFSYIFSHKYAQAGVLAMLLVFISGATSYASLNTLPGDMLYGVKTRVVEKVPRILYNTPQLKAEDNVRKIEKRIKEFEQLAETGRLSEENTSTIEKEIEKNLGEFDEQIKEIKEIKKTAEETELADADVPPAEDTGIAAMKIADEPGDTTPAEGEARTMMVEVEVVEEETVELEEHLNERLLEHAEKIIQIREEEIQETEKVLESILERAGAAKTTPPDAELAD